MAKQTFKTLLNFQNVPIGSLEDKVIMRTADGDIKELPSDSFGGGGSPTFQEVMEVGSAYNKSTPDYGIEMSIDENEVVIASSEKESGVNKRNSFLNLGGNYFMLGFFRNLGEKGFQVGRDGDDDEDEFGVTAISGSFRSKFRFKNPFGLTTNTRFELPSDKPDGTYTVATTDDLAEAITVTKSAFDALVSSSSLMPNAEYKITGVEAGWCDIIVKAISNNSIAISGIGIFKNPDYNTYQLFNDTIGGFTFSDMTGTFEYGEEVTSNNGAKAVFYTQNVMKYISGDWEASTSMTGGNSGATVNITDTYNPEAYNIDDIVIWGGSHWKNVTGLVSASLDEFNLDENWVKTDEGTKEVGDKIEYNYEGDFISMRSDINGNVIRSRSSVKGFQWGRNEHIFNNISEFGGEVLNIQELSLRFSSVKNCFLESKCAGLTVGNSNISTLKM